MYNLILPNYEEIIIKDTKVSTHRIIKFDKLSVRIYGDARYSKTDINYSINLGCRRRNIDLSVYINSINDYFISHSVYKKYEDRVVNLFDFECVNSLTFKGLRFNSNEFQIIRSKYPNVDYVRTENCTLYKEAQVGNLTCNYYDNSSDILSLDSFNGFSGESIYLNQSHVLHRNKNVLHLNNIIMKLRGINLDYEYFFLTTSAPNLRKIEIHTKPLLKDKDLLFLSGFYNLESVQIDAILSNYNQLQKLEKLKELRYIFCSDEKELEKTKEKRKEIYEKLVINNATKNQLRNYLMMQRMLIQNKFQDLQHELYVPRLERVKWENKISSKNLKNIRNELISISNMSVKECKNLSREKREYTVFDSFQGLDFDYSPSEEEYILIDFHPFEENGMKYYAKRNNNR